MCRKAWGFRLLGHARSQWPGPSTKWAAWWAYHSCCQYVSVLWNGANFCLQNGVDMLDCGSLIHTGYGCMALRSWRLTAKSRPMCVSLCIGTYPSAFQPRYIYFFNIQEGYCGHRGGSTGTQDVSPSCLQAGHPVAVVCLVQLPYLFGGLEAFRTAAKTPLVPLRKVLSCFRSKQTRYS